MSWKMIAPVFAAAALALSAPAHAGSCDGLEGKELKKCEKQAAAQAKADARSTPFTPSALDSSLSAWDAEDKNPFATDEYRVRVTEAGFESIDSYLAKAFKMQATIAFARYLVDETAKGNADAMKAIPTLKPMVEAAVNDGKALIDEGKSLAGSVTDEIKKDPKLAMKAPKMVSALNDGVSALTGTIDQAPDVAKSLASVASNPGAAAGAAGGMAAEKAADAAEGAME